MMNAIGLPLLISTQRMQALVGQTRADLDLARIEAVTSRAADVAKATGGDIGKVQQLDKQIADVGQRLSSLQLLKSDFAVVNEVLDSVRSRGAQIATEVEAAVGLENQAGLDALAIQSEADFHLIVGSLNASFAGRQLFSGAKTDTAPIADAQQILDDVAALVAAAPNAAAVETALDAYFDDPAGTFQTVIYQGSTTAAPDRDIAEARRMGVDAKATDLGIRSVLRGLALLAAAEDNAADPSVRAQIRLDAAATLRDGVDAVVGQQSRFGALEGEADVLISRGEAVRFTYQTSLTALIGVDQYAAASRMTALETQLEAAYLTTARIANLSLVNYLR